MLLVAALVSMLVSYIELTTAETLDNVKILALLRDFGQAKTDVLNAEITYANQRIAQYLVVTMLTEKEFQASQSWDTSVMNVLQTENRIQYFRNVKKDARVGPFKKGETIHGELLFLYIEGDNIGDLSNKLPDDGSEEKPCLLMFSFYIPCACVQKCNFNCAEELKSAAKLYRDKYKFIVGFDNVYSGTDENSSQTFLRDGGIELYQYLDQQFNLFQIIPQTTNAVQQMFQTALSILLLQRKELQQCLPSDTNKRGIIAASFIKHLINLCIRADKIVQKLSAELTKFSRAWLFRALSDTVPNVIAKECQKNGIGEKRIAFLMSTLIESAITQSTHIGHPKVGTLDQFEVFSGTLSRILDIPARLMPAEIQCEPSTLTLESFCTKSKPTHTQKILQNVRNSPTGQSSRSKP